MANQALARLESALRARKLDRTLTSLLPQASTDPTRYAPTGIPAVDRALAGGFPCGQLSEIVGVPASGRTTVLLHALGGVTERGDLAALIDTFDHLDSASVDAARIVPERMLWVRGVAHMWSSAMLLERAVNQAIKAFNLVLEAGGFGLVAIDLADVPPAVLRRLPLTTWLRIQRTIEGSDTACVLVGSHPIARSADGVTLALDAPAQHVRWQGESDMSRRLTGLEISGRVIPPRRRVHGTVTFNAVSVDTKHQAPSTRH